MLVVDVSFLHACTNKWHPTASTLCPLSLPRKKAQAVSLSYTQSKAQMNHPREFPDYIECYTYCIMALGWLKKEEEEERKNEEDERLWLLTISGLPL